MNFTDADLASWRAKGLEITEGATQSHVAQMEILAPPKSLKNKYNNVKTVGADGVTYDSGKEARRATELRLLEANGAITRLQFQHEFELCVHGVLVCHYRADATYWCDGEFVVEDTKSAITRKHPVYRIKVKLMRAIYGIEIREV